MSATIVIAAVEHLATFKEREELAGAIVFSDAEALKALEVITRRRPEIVLLDRVFAETSRGAALVNRIKADPSLGACEIRIVEEDRSYTEVASTRTADHAPPSPGDAGATAIVVEELPQPPIAALDQSGTRAAPRFRMEDGIKAEIDGNPASVVNLSVSGAQVVSPTILKPNQRVRFILPSAKPHVRFKAVVAWASFEIPKGESRYRAGIQFFGADPVAIHKFIERHKV